MKEFVTKANDICQRLLTSTPIKASLLKEFCDDALQVINAFHAVKATLAAFPPVIDDDVSPKKDKDDEN